MQEQEFRAFIQMMTKRLIPQLQTLTTARERVAFVLQQPETREIQEKITNAKKDTEPSDEIAASSKDSSSSSSTASSWHFGTKNAELAKRNREDGNAAFQVRDGEKKEILMKTCSASRAPIESACLQLLPLFLHVFFFFFFFNVEEILSTKPLPSFLLLLTRKNGISFQMHGERKREREALVN